MSDSKSICFPAIIKFGANWCGPCKKIQPLFKELSDKYPKIKCYHFDADDDEDAVEEIEKSLKIKVKALPFFVLADDNRVIDKFEGSDGKALREMFEKASRRMK